MKKIFVCFTFVFVFMFGCKSTVPASAPVAAVELSLIATDIAFDKTQIEVLVNQPIKLTLINDGVLEHDFSILKIPSRSSTAKTDEKEAGHQMSNMEANADIHVAAQAGSQNTLEFTPVLAGKYEYYCTVPGHKEAGMDGFLTVIGS